MATFIKIRETLYNVDKFIKIEEFNDFQAVLNPETGGDITRHFTTIRMYFSEDSFITVRNFSVNDFEKLLKNKKASQ